MSGAGRPVLDLELAHREVSGVARDQPCANTYGRGRDEAVRLAESESTAGEVSAPPPGALALGTAERGDAQAPEKARHSHFLIGPGATQNLLDVHRTDVRHSLALAQPSKSLGGGQSS